MGFRQHARRLLGKVNSEPAPKLQSALKTAELALTEIADIDESPERFFMTRDGHSLPVYPSYRYGLKRGWLFFPSLAALQELNQRALLPKPGQDFLAAARGGRTITMSLKEIDETARQWIAPHADRFIGQLLPPQDNAYFDPGTEGLDASCRQMAEGYKKLLSRLDSVSNRPVASQTGRNLLEIGFNDGLSPLAWERLGFKTTAIDNSYKAETTKTISREISSRLGGSADFQHGDICKRLEYDDGHFSLISSVSVLEHILDLSSAFSEMNRLLGKDGYLIHSYHPYFGPDGGHALGNPDCPWGHVRMSVEDYQAYLVEHRPFEAEVASRWLKEGLNRSHTIAQMQGLLANAGFELLLWREDAAPLSRLSGLNPEVLRQAAIHYPGISLRDMTTQTVLFMARKAR